MVRIQQTTFNQTVTQFVNSGTRRARNRVWDYINSLPNIYFVQCGRQACPVPWIMFEDDVPTAMVFTDYEHAIQAAKLYIEDGDNVRVVGLPTNAASMYMTAIAAQGVNHVCFNHGPHRFDSLMDEVLLTLGLMTR